MFSSGLTKLTTSMIYAGTLLLSILSFFTTFFGMKILLDTSLAFIGSLGLQIALLGVAWNLMKIREGRINYVIVFLSAAVFSIFFSFANFDTALKSTSRTGEARTGYFDAAQPIIAEYGAAAKMATQRGKYQTERIGKLLEIEQERGWATMVNEGSKDSYIQSVIDGARLAVISWEAAKGQKYQQGPGRGIVVNYLESHLARTQNNVKTIETYSKLIDSLTLALSGKHPVEKQFGIVNQAWSMFPVGAINLMTGGNPELTPPPNTARYIEQPQTRQQAFMLVINDFIEMDYTALFALLLAIVIDLIVIIMALAGSNIHNEEDYLFNRLRVNATRQLRQLRLNDKEAIAKTVNGNLDKLRRAGQYGLDLLRVHHDYKTNKKRFKIVMKRGEENAPESAIENRGNLWPQYSLRLNKTHKIDGFSSLSKSDHFSANIMENENEPNRNS